MSNRKAAKKSVETPTEVTETPAETQLEVAEVASEETAPVSGATKGLVEKPAKAPKPAVDRLTKVIESQQAPTLWQYARLAKAIVQRTEAGQPSGEAFDAVIQQTVSILNGILAEQPASSKDADVDGATKAYFAQFAAKSLERARGPKADAE